jgi:hypothetical protein
MTQPLPSSEVYHPRLPLAVYREVAAHLRQVIGVEVDLLPPQSTQFNYNLSQVGGLRLRFTSEASQASQQQAQQILAYYGDRFGTWQLPT